MLYENQMQTKKQDQDQIKENPLVPKKATCPIDVGDFDNRGLARVCERCPQIQSCAQLV